MSPGRQKKLLLFSSSLNKFLNLSTSISENPITKFYETSSGGSHAVPFGQTDRQTKSLVVAFLRNRFGNASEKRKTQIIWPGYWPRLTWIICMYVCVFGEGVTLKGWVSGWCTRHTTHIWRPGPGTSSPAFSAEPFPFREKYVIVKLEVELKTFPSLSFLLYSSFGYNVLYAAAVTITGHRQNLSLCETTLIHLNLTTFLCWVLSLATYTVLSRCIILETYLMPHLINKGTRWRSCLRHCATSRKVACSIPVRWESFCSTVALGWTQLLREMSIIGIAWGVKVAGP
jgi:hypothetical protein